MPRGDHWDADIGAVFDLQSNALRPVGWTSADAAGLPILAGLVRYDEVAAGRSTTRCASPCTNAAGLHPPGDARGVAEQRPDLPPMGLRLRLRGDFDTRGSTGKRG